MEIGNYNRILATGAVNIPLVDDKVAMRAAFQSVKHDGYMKDGTDDENDVGGRVQCRFDPANTSPRPDVLDPGRTGAARAATAS